MLLNILLTLLVLVCVALTAVILLQRSEGGALGMGGGSNSMFSARGAANLLTRVTSILAGAFFALALTIVLLSGAARRSDSVAERIDLSKPGVAAAPLPVQPAQGADGPAAQGQPGAAPPLPDAAPPLPGAAPAPAAPPLPSSSQ